MEVKHRLTVNPRSTFLVLLSPSRTMAGRTDATLLFPQYNAEFAIDSRLPVMTTSSSMTVLRSRTDTSSPCANKPRARFSTTDNRGMRSAARRADARRTSGLGTMPCPSSESAPHFIVRHRSRYGRLRLCLAGVGRTVVAQIPGLARKNIQYLTGLASRQRRSRS